MWYRLTMTDTPASRMYERLVASFEVEAAGMDASVTPNASLIGSISGVPRQIDVLVDARFENNNRRRIIFDAKLAAERWRSRTSRRSKG
jgi:hypothetical protein